MYSTKWTRLCCVMSLFHTTLLVESFQARGAARVYRSSPFYSTQQTSVFRSMVPSTLSKLAEKGANTSTTTRRSSLLQLSSVNNESSRPTTRKRQQRQQITENTSAPRKTARVSKTHGSIAPTSNSALPEHKPPTKQASKKKFSTPMPKGLAAAIQLNKEIMSCETPTHVLNLFVKAGGARNTGGNGVLSSVNFSTMIHRIAKQANVVTGPRGGKGAANRHILVDPRLAILLCAIAEALAQDVSMVAAESNGVSNEHKFFKSRELSNIAWALAKMQHLAPSKQAMNVVRCTRRHKVNGDDHQHHSNDDSRFGDNEPEESFVEFTDNLTLLADNLRSTSALLRQQILQIAQTKQGGSDGEGPARTSYMPTLRKLAGHILDAIAASVLDTINVSEFNTQEYANLIWAFATVKRGDTLLSEELVLRLMARARANVVQQSKLAGGSNKQDHGMKPQEVSNSVWALATMGTRGPAQVAFLQYCAELLDDRDEETLLDDRNVFLHSFKAQELANTAWAAVTLLSKHADKTTESYYFIDDPENDEERMDAESAAVQRILRRVLMILNDAPDSFKSQEVSNILWACATSKFGCSTQQPPPTRLLDDALLMRETLINVAYSAAKRLHDFVPQELNNLSWSYARLLEPINTNPVTSATTKVLPTGDEDVAPTGTIERYTAAVQDAKEAVTVLFRGIGSEIQTRRGKFAPQDIGTTLWAYSTLGFSYSTYGEGEVARIEGGDASADAEKYAIADLETIYKTAANLVCVLGAHTFKPQELSNSLWALATAGMIPKYLYAFDVTIAPLKGINEAGGTRRDTSDDPITMCFGAAANELITRPREFKEQEIKDILWAFSKVGALKRAILKVFGRLCLSQYWRAIPGTLMSSST